MTLGEVKIILAGMEQNSAEEKNEALRIAIRVIELYQDCAYCHDCAKAIKTNEKEFLCTSDEYDINRKSCFVLKTE